MNEANKKYLEEARNLTETWEKVTEIWEKTGLLDNIEEKDKKKVAILLESQRLANEGKEIEFSKFAKPLTRRMFL